MRTAPPHRHTRLALLVLAASSAMAGFDGGCGATPGEPLPPPPPPPPEQACVDRLDETSCLAEASCTAIYVETDACACDAVCRPDGNGGCLPCECPPATRTFVGCQDDPVPSACADLDEGSCSANQACEPLYTACGAEVDGGAGARAPCDPGTGRCGCNEAPTYSGCRDRPAECGPVCDIFCPFGNVVDANGCPTCACNPDPTGCSGLGEEQCLTAGDRCRAVYGAGGGGSTEPGPGDDDGADRDPCFCDPNSGICGCGEPVPPPPGFLYCEPNTTPVACQGLDENTCASTPGCHGEYVQGRCAAPCDPSVPGCGGDVPNCPAVFVCVPDQTKPECFSDSDCPNGYCEWGGSGFRPEEPGDGGAPIPPPPGGQCVSVSCGERSNVFCAMPPPDCGPGRVAGPLNGCWACFDARTCQPSEPGQCRSDVDCPTGYCEYGAGSGGGSGGAAPPAEEDPARPDLPVPPPAGQCVAVSCGDGTQILCDAIPPVCGPGAVAGALNGCYGCYDARTCTLLGPPAPECLSDADCPNGFCAANGGEAPPSGGSSDAPELRPEPIGGQCVFPLCGDGSALGCRALPPVCAPGFVVSIVNGCWECLDGRTCGGSVSPCDPATTDCG